MRRLIALALLLVCAAAGAHDMAGMAMGHETPLGFDATLDAQGHLWVVDTMGEHVRVRRSDDMGRSFPLSTIVNPTGEPLYAEGENRPKIALGPKDELYVTWSQPRKLPWTGFVRFSRSLDGGEHFDAPKTVHTDRAEITHRFDALAVDGNGNVIVAWIDKRDVEAAKASGKPYLGAATYYSWSSDRGDHFVPERKIVDQSCECCRIALARAPDGSIDAFFRAIYGDNIRDHAFASLPTDGSAPNVQRATFTQWHIEGCPHHGPSLAVDGTGVRHAVWFSAADGKAVIWYGQLQPGKAPAHLATIAGAGASHADLAVDGKQVWIAYHQMSANGLDLMLRVSTDGGTTFFEPRAIAHTESASGWPKLVLWQHRAFVAWNPGGTFRLVPTEAL
ncbi:exo-alpha-sialidase [Luteibacter flocculans]|uniref:Exo-alpha-sialidase n=1 Tax=Luteibacter flocculans TaxID=2780091 RepID=A0ABY4T0Z2_9GAMM|nr:exo-alpha-sialidase [Luteibacter flocculans]URL57523.1 exo-alpha-sialidase [Luteibacter flocculans]